MRLSRYLEQVFTQYKKKPAISRYLSAGSLQTVTYGQLEERVKKFALFLNQQGMRPNDLVMCYMIKSIDSATAILATIFNGGAACSLNFRLKPHQMVSMSALARSRFIILDQSTMNHVIKSEEAMTSPNQFILFSESPEVLRSDNFHSKVRTFTCGTQNNFDMLEDGNTAPAFTNCADSPGYCLFTSGSTGEQKGVLISRDDLVERVSTEIEDYEISEADNLLSLLPFSFDVGLNQFLSSILSGSHLVILNSWFPRDVVSAIKHVGISGISAVPTIWADMLSFPQDGAFGDDTKTLRYITVSGGDLAPNYLTQLRRYFKNVNIYKTYGQSETFRSSILKPHDFERKMTSVGQPVKGTQIFILDENGMIAPPDTEGEIVHYGAGTMLSYINEVQGSRNKIREIPTALKDTLVQGKIVFTGDRGKIDNDGFLYVLGREDGMIKTMGYRVYPREIENCILEHPKVKRAAVVGIPDARKGQTTIAEIVTNDMLDEKELVAYLRERLPYYMVPDDVQIVERLPLSENGKIQYAEIKGRHEKRRILCAHSEGKSQSAY